MIILASQSAVRSALLTAAGVHFRAVKSSLNETALHIELAGLPPRHLAQRLAQAKAQPISIANPQALTIGVDQTLEFEGCAMHKPTDIAQAKRQLQNLRGQTHALHSAYSLWRDNKEIAVYCATSALTMRNFSDHFLQDYLDHQGTTLLSTVGCYHLEGRGAQLMQNIDGDYHSILGLPLMPLLEDLRQCGELQS